MKKSITGIFVLSAMGLLLAQQPTNQSSILGPNSGVINGVYTPEHLPNRKPIPYTPVREADVIWTKRIWRVIDLREKENFPLLYPLEEVAQRPALFSVIQKGILTQELSVYDPSPAVFTPDEEFKIELPFAEAQKTYIREISILKQDTATGEYIPTTIPDTIKPADIAQYWLKEDWFFDKQRSIMDVRILGIAPVIESTDDKGEFKSYRAIFWLYYPGCRNYFSKYQAYNPYNDAEWRSYDELFQKRFFSSYIRQESNVYNRPIIAYTTGMEALMESERIKNDIFKFEHDMWHY